MSNLSRLLIILILLILCLTCCVPTRRHQAPSPLPNLPKEYLTITTAYTSSVKGTDIALFAESSNKKINISFPGGKSPDITDVQKMTSLTPAANIPITVFPLKVDNPADIAVESKTDSSGHLNLHVTFINGIITPTGWNCSTVVSWQTSTDNVIFPNGGSVIICDKYQTDQS